jgi:hypothetical protein
MRPRQEFLQRLRDHGRQRPPRRGGMRPDPRDERHRQFDGEHRGRGGHRNMSGPAGALHVAVRLPGRTAEPAGQLPRGVGCRHTRVQQVRGGVDPLGEHVTTSATGRPTTRHVTNILLDMSRRRTDTPRQFDTPIAQRHLKAEIANCVGGVSSPLLANIYLHVLDTELSTRGVGELVRYADDGVVLCRSAARAEHALVAVGEILASLGLRLHPDKTKVVDLREGRDGLDFLGCHFRARMSGRLWEQKRTIRYYLHRRPSQTAMARVRVKVRDRTGRNRVGIDIRDVIAELNPILRGWGNYFRTGNAAIKFIQIDRYVVWRLHRLLIKKRGRNLRAGQADQWTEEWFNGHGLHRLRGTIRYPKAA